jgi:hypothetical protein
LITLRRRSEPRFWPLESIGVDEPMFVAGAIAAMSEASVIQTPADAERAPLGETYVITGIFEAISVLTILRIDSERPPGVSMTITAAS